MTKYTIEKVENNNIILAFDGRRVVFPLPIVDGKYPEGQALENLLNAYVKNAVDAGNGPTPIDKRPKVRFGNTMIPFTPLMHKQIMQRRLLHNTKWTQDPKAPLTPNERVAWNNYRQLLIDIPKQVNFPRQIIWPIPPSPVKNKAGVVFTAFDGRPTQGLRTLPAKFHLKQK